MDFQTRNMENVPSSSYVRMDQPPVLLAPTVLLPYPGPRIGDLDANLEDLDEHGFPHPLYFNWRTMAFDCLNFVIPNCCLSFWLPCITFSQINSRMAMLPYPVSLLFSFGAWAGIIAGIVMWALRDCYWTDVFATNTIVYTYYVCDYDAVNDVGIVLVWVALATLIGLLCWQRSYVRHRLELPAEPFLDSLFAACCSWCSLAQLASQVGAFRKDECSLSAPPKSTLVTTGQRRPHLQQQGQGMYVDVAAATPPASAVAGGASKE